MNSHELANIIDMMIQKNVEKDIFRLATVTGIVVSGVRVQFDGESVSSTKYYPYMGTGITLAVGDRVIMVRIKGSYAVLGQLMSKQATNLTGYGKIYTGDSNGDGLAIGAGGRVVVGSGESFYNLIEYFIAQGEGITSENLHLASDSSVFIETGIQAGAANRYTFQFGNDGKFTRSRYKEGNGFQTLTQRVPSPNHYDPMMIQDFTGSVDIGTGLQAFADFTFPVAFTETPIWVTVGGRDSNSTNACFGVYNITATGCRVYATRVRDSSTTTMAPNFQVVACGKKI